MKNGNWVNFGIKCLIVLVLLVGWSFWDGQRRKQELADIQEANALSNESDDETAEDSAENPSDKRKKKRRNKKRNSDSSAGNDETSEAEDQEISQQQQVAANSTDQGTGGSDSASDASASGEKTGSIPIGGIQIPGQATDLLGNLLGQAGKQLMGTTFADYCSDFRKKGQVELSEEQEDDILEVFKFAEERNSIYAEKLRIARAREFAMFSGLVELVSTESLTDIVLRNRRDLSKRGKTIWDNYVFSYETFRKEASQPVYGGMEAWEFSNQSSRLFGMSELKRSISRGKIDYGELLALEGQVRFLRHEFETLWLGDIMIQSIVAEIPASEFEFLDHEMLETVLRPEELKRRHIIYATKNNEANYLPDQEDSILDKERAEEALKPNKQSRAEFQKRMRWLKSGPDSAAFEKAIQSLVRIRGDKVDYDWPQNMAESIFTDARPAFENPFE